MEKYTFPLYKCMVTTFTIQVKLHGHSIKSLLHEDETSYRDPNSDIIIMLPLLAVTITPIFMCFRSSGSIVQC